MSIADQLFASLKQAVPQMKDELGRLGTQGANELASALFHGTGTFVQYGPGQTIDKEKQPEVEQQRDISIER